MPATKECEEDTLCEQPSMNTPSSRMVKTRDVAELIHFSPKSTTLGFIWLYLMFLCNVLL